MGTSSALREVGRVIDDRYRLEAYLGGGAMGDVFRARHVKVGRCFAIKILHPHLVADAKLLARFEREAQIAAKLRHPNLVPVLDLGDADGDAFLVMELAVGDTLAALLDERAVFEGGRAIRIIRQLCDGLAYAHDLGLVCGSATG
jgi:eukaryotic-like serine/threonine-protein kinase